MNKQINHLDSGYIQTFKVSALKYRPQKLSQLYGQDGLVNVLTESIQQNKLPHGLILTGMRGVGKTTVARILAKSLNCIGHNGQGSQTIDPCGQCDLCQRIASSTHIDVLEIDAATHTGVDDMREIIDSSRYTPVSARYKIFIIDEVHMLSKSAFNALLKTLEEPPANVKFVFATTEVHKVPLTVLSRCMRFDLNSISIKDLVRLFQWVLSQEKCEYEEDALHLLAQAAQGSARDGLSLLDQTMLLGSRKISLSQVRSMLGKHDPAALITLFEAVCAGKPVEAYKQYHVLTHLGVHPKYILEEVLALFETLNMLILKQIPDNPYPEKLLLCLQKLAENATIPLVHKLWQGVVQAMEDMEKISYTIEGGAMVITRLCYLSHLPLPEEILKSIDTATSHQQGLKEGANTSAPQKKNYHTEASYAQFITDLKADRQPLLYAKVIESVCPLHCTPTSLSYVLNDDGDPHVAQELSQWAKKRYGENYTIVFETNLTNGRVLPPWQKQKETKAQKELTQDTVTKEVLDTFPGTVVEKIIPK